LKLDCHTHLVAANSPTDGYARAPLRRFAHERAMRWQLKLGRAVSLEEAAREYEERLAGWVRGSELDRAVVLAFDQIYREDGSADRGRTYLHIENDHVRDACARHPGTFLYGASVHPFRPDALEELERVREDGAVLVKLLPNSHGFDPADSRLAPYFRKLADLGLPLLCHCGYEHTIPVIDQRYGDPSRLSAALEQGVTVIVAHVGTAGLTHLRETFGAFLELLVKHPNCYGDTSALTNLWRSSFLPLLVDPERLARRFPVVPDDLPSRLVHGSDVPIPITPAALFRHVPSRVRRRLKKLANPLQLDIELKRHVGLPDACLTRASDALQIGEKLRK
jgi:predicted TIM-barrel fold metal-dependent hydrolase